MSPNPCSCPAYITPAYQRRRYALRLWASQNLPGFVVTPETLHTPLPSHSVWTRDRFVTACAEHIRDCGEETTGLARLDDDGSHLVCPREHGPLTALDSCPAAGISAIDERAARLAFAARSVLMAQTYYERAYPDSPARWVITRFLPDGWMFARSIGSAQVLSFAPGELVPVA